jgi:hypothetical protein
MADIYLRQAGLNLHVPSTAMVIGVGGVGSWVALDLALVGVKRLVLVDPDKIEASNLNRTPFKLKHVGMAKVKAVLELIYERRDGEVLLFQKKLEELSPAEILFLLPEVIVDCRDVLADVPAGLRQVPRVKLGYDGFSMTIHANPSKKVWGSEPVRYSVTPSFLVPPQILAALVVGMITSKKIPREEERVWSFSLEDLIRGIMGSPLSAEEQTTAS